MPSSETATLLIFAFSHLNLQWGTQSKWCILWLDSYVGPMMQILQATSWSWGGGMWPSPELLKNFMCGLQECLGQRTRGPPSSSHLPWDANWACLEGCSQKLAREFLNSGLRRRMSQDSGLCGNTRCQSKRSIVTETPWDDGRHLRLRNSLMSRSFVSRCGTSWTGFPSHRPCPNWRAAMKPRQWKSSPLWMRQGASFPFCRCTSLGRMLISCHFCFGSQLLLSTIGIPPTQTCFCRLWRSCGKLADCCSRPVPLWSTASNTTNWTRKK